MYKGQMSTLRGREGNIFIVELIALATSLTWNAKYQKGKQGLKLTIVFIIKHFLD